MRTLLLTFFIPLLLGFGLLSATNGHIVFAIITFMRPHSFAWGVWQSKPVFLFAVIALAISTAVHRNFAFRMNKFTALALLFFGWLALCCVYADDPQVSWKFYQRFLVMFPPVLILLVSTIHTLDMLKKILWAFSLSIMVIGAKVGFAGIAAGGAHITDQINGFVGDNNVLALSLCLSLGLMFGLTSSLKKKMHKGLCQLGILGCILTILFTQSRGGFLSLGLFTVISAVLSKKPLRNILILLIAATTIYLTLPPETFGRLNTLSDVEQDESATGRLDQWKLAFDISKKLPIFGVGTGGFLPYIKKYYPDAHGLVTHSVYFQVLSTTGYPGLLIYLSLFMITFFSLNTMYTSTRWFPQDHPYQWIAPTAFGMRNGLVAYMFGAAFLDMMVYDIPWYFMFYAGVMRSLLPQAFEEQAEAEEKSTLNPVSSLT
jgi:probable O-glycosylation ligase (exosortase A-associated)